MSRTLSIRFQSPEQLTGPARDLLALLKSPTDPASGVRPERTVEPLPVPPSPEQEQLNVQAVRRRLRMLEKERALRTVDGAATWILTDRMSVAPDLGERIGSSIVGAGLGKGRIVYGPPNLCLASGRYMAVIEFKLTNMLDNRWARMTGEVILNNQRYLSQQSKTLSANGSYVFRLPFRVREKDLLRQAAPWLEVRLNLRSVVGVEVTQVAILSRASSARSFLAHPGAHLHSVGNAWLKWLGRQVVKPRA